MEIVQFVNTGTEKKEIEIENLLMAEEGESTTMMFNYFTVCKKSFTHQLARNPSLLDCRFARFCMKS
jgi:hypothetical protein